VLFLEIPFVDVPILIKSPDFVERKARLFFKQFVSDKKGSCVGSWIVEARLVKKSQNILSKKRVVIYKDKVARKTGCYPKTCLCFEGTTISANFEKLTVTSVNRRELSLQTIATIRAIIDQELFKKGFVLLHGGAVTMNGEGWLLCGEKGSGKTTTLLWLIKKGANYVANDRIFFGTKNGKVLIVPRPSFARIGIVTASQYSQFECFISEEHRSLLMSEHFSDLHLPKLEIAYLPDVFFCGAESMGVVKKVIFPSFGSAEFKKIGTKEGLERLEKNVLDVPPGLQLTEAIFGKIPKINIENLSSNTLKKLTFCQINCKQPDSLLL
jgi:hypothetical protein